MSSSSIGAAAFHPTIPVVDMNDFFNPATKQGFVDAVSQASQKVGFFAVVNPNIDVDAITRAYDASEKFFHSSDELKREIYEPENNGQRGWIPGETAQGAARKDHKEFVHIGYKDNLWPTWMDLQTPMEELIRTLDEVSAVLQQTFALAIGENEGYFINTTATGNSLLRPIYYPANPSPGACWAAKHTDIDLFTILPKATEEGLQVFHDDKWISVDVPADSVIINVGDQLQNLTNGFFTSSIHQVVAKPDTERRSIVYFVHPESTTPMNPTENCIRLTGDVKRYPDATSFELLATRLRELGIASQYLKDFEAKSGLMGRVKALVDADIAAPAVQMTWNLRNQGL